MLTHCMPWKYAIHLQQRNVSAYSHALPGTIYVCRRLALVVLCSMLLLRSGSQAPGIMSRNQKSRRCVEVQHFIPYDQYDTKHARLSIAGHHLPAFAPHGTCAPKTFCVDVLQAGSTQDKGCDDDNPKPARFSSQHTSVYASPPTSIDASGSAAHAGSPPPSSQGIPAQHPTPPAPSCTDAPPAIERIFRPQKIKREEITLVRSIMLVTYCCSWATKGHSKITQNTNIMYVPASLPPAQAC
jgi:hypothetical protein